MRYLKWILILGILAPPPGYTQSICRITETVDMCRKRLADELQTQQMQTGQQVADEVRAKPSPADFQDSAAGSSKKDFLPRFLAALQTAKLDNQKQELDLAWNFHPDRMDLQLQSVVHKPELFKPLKDQLTQAGQTDRAGELESGLNDLDDVSIGLTYNLENAYFGRRFEKNRDSLFVPLFSGVLAQVRGSSERTIAAKDKLLTLLRDLNLGDDNLEKINIRDIPDNRKAEVEARILDFAAAGAEFDREESQAIKTHRLKAFADLVDNQPQLIVTASSRRKAEDVGPDEFGAQASLEYGFYSVNGYRGAAKKNASNALTTFDDYTSGFRARAGMRVKFTAEYKWVQKYSRHSQVDGIDLDQPSANRWSLSASYGQRVLFNGKGEELARIDLTGTYENFSDDPDHKDRGILDLSYTQKVSDTLSLPIGITYANHDRFLSDVQKSFGVHFGLHAKIFTGN